MPVTPNGQTHQTQDMGTIFVNGDMSCVHGIGYALAIEGMESQCVQANGAVSRVCMLASAMKLVTLMRLSLVNQIICADRRRFCNTTEFHNVNRPSHSPSHHPSSHARAVTQKQSHARQSLATVGNQCACNRDYLCPELWVVISINNKVINSAVCTSHELI